MCMSNQEPLHEIFDFKKVQQKIRYKFRDKQLLLAAFTHSTYANTFKLKNNQRLEFLGDSVLGLSVAEWLVENSTEREGSLSTVRSHIVNEKNLCLIMDKMGVADFLLVNKGQKDQELKTLPSVKADLFEAILGAIYLDAGFNVANKWTLAWLNLNKKQATQVIETLKEQDYKTKLQEMLQQTPHSKIEYNVVEESGKPHERVYTMQILVNDRPLATESGTNKKQVEQKLAKQALNQLKNTGEF